MDGRSSLRAGLLAALALCAGCDSSAPFDYQPASGTVLYEDGQPISNHGFTVYFVPQVESPDGEMHARFAKASVDADGVFSQVTSYKYGDGLIPGKHKVFLEVGKGADGKPAVSPQYLKATTTPLIVDSTSSSELAIRLPRP